MAVTIKTKTLSKLGADVRWYLEQCGVNPEQTAVIIAVPNVIAQSRMIEGFLRDFDNGGVMKRDDNSPHRVVVHGVPIWVMVEQKTKKEAA